MRTWDSDGVLLYFTNWVWGLEEKARCFCIDLFRFEVCCVASSTLCLLCLTVQFLYVLPKCVHLKNNFLIFFKFV